MIRFTKPHCGTARTEMCGTIPRPPSGRIIGTPLTMKFLFSPLPFVVFPSSSPRSPSRRRCFFIRATIRAAQLKRKVYRVGSRDSLLAPLSRRRLDLARLIINSIIWHSCVRDSRGSCSFRARDQIGGPAREGRLEVVYRRWNLTCRCNWGSEFRGRSVVC